MKHAIAGFTAGLLLLATFPVLFAGGDTDPASPACDGQQRGSRLRADVHAAVTTIRDLESGGDYQARASGSTASGAYGFTDATWNGYGGYASAHLAPQAVQDAKAAEQVNRILAANDDDIAAVPVIWYLGYLPAPGDPAWDRVPSPGAGNRLTPRQYQAEWLAVFTTHLDSDAAPNTRDATTTAANPSCAGSTPAAPRTDIRLTTVEGITVNSQIASQVAGLVQAARADAFTLTGGGYRSPQRQVELRRQNCGSSQYAIYEMPSSSCSPPTARPGSSNHEMGLAIDFSCNGSLIRSRSSSCFAWMSANAARFGLHNLPSEPWHWSYNGK